MNTVHHVCRIMRMCVCEWLVGMYVVMLVCVPAVSAASCRAEAYFSLC